jgi:1-hydroxycarotenoid 3,4-desaturase
LPEHRVVVVGAGIGGLCAALRLAGQGMDVTVVDAAERPGGKMRPLQVNGQPVDAGPTVFTMRWVLDELLDELGTSAEQALPPLQPLSVLARHAWRTDGSRLDLHADRTRSAEAIADFASPAEGRRYLAFCDEAQRVYHQLEGPHIRSGRPSFVQMVADLGPRGLATLAGLGPLATLSATLSRRFTDPRLQQLFGRYATYCGAAPGLAPATLMLVAHVEQAGVWAVQGGMAALAQSLAALLQQRGARCASARAAPRSSTPAAACTASGSTTASAWLRTPWSSMATSARSVRCWAARERRCRPQRQPAGARCRR